MAPNSKLGRGKPLKSQTKEVLHKIHNYFEKEIARDPNSTVTAAQLVVHSTGISMNALKRVITEYKTNTTVKKESMKPKRRFKKTLLPSTDLFDGQSIRKIIHNFYAKDEEFPIMKDLHLILKADNDYQGSLCTLRRQVARLGFRWVETEDNSSILIEKQDFRYARIHYLTKIEEYRNIGRSVVYTGETSMESSTISSVPKQDGTSTILKHPAKSRFVTLLAGDQNGILKNTLFIFDGNKKDVKEESESKRECFEQYESWFKHYLIPILKPNSVVVVDAACSFNNRLANPTPHSNSKKKEMMDWLSSRNVPYSINMYKPQLYHLVLLNKDKHTDYKVDVLLRDHGHSVLRLPPHYNDLNPIKLVLTNIKDYVGHDIRLKIDSAMKIASEKVTSITKEEWRQACLLAETEENFLKATEVIIDEISERNKDFIASRRYLNMKESDESEMDDDNDDNGDESMDSD